MKIKLESDQIKTVPAATQLKFSPSQIDTVKEKAGGKKSRVRLTTSTARYKGKIQTRQS
jgi:hypothetical protein